MNDHCREALEKIYTSLDRELDDRATEEIRLHLEDCPPCDRRFTFEERLQVVIKLGMREQVPVEVLQRLQAVLRAERAR